MKKKIERKGLKEIVGGGEPLPEGWGICIVNNEHIPNTLR